MDITLTEIMYIGFAALVITWIYTRVRVVSERSRMPGRFDFDPKDISRILLKCYDLFPIERLRFKGAEYKRGMAVRVTTTGNKTFEGRLIGSNSQNIICVLSKDHIAADALDNVAEIKLLED